MFYAVQNYSLEVSFEKLEVHQNNIPLDDNFLFFCLENRCRSLFETETLNSNPNIAHKVTSIYYNYCNPVWFKVGDLLRRMLFN